MICTVYYERFSEDFNLPGQGCMEHCSTSSGLPLPLALQYAPFISILLKPSRQALVLLVSPPPQSNEQFDQALHVSHSEIILGAKTFHLKKRSTL